MEAMPCSASYCALGVMALLFTSLDRVLLHALGSFNFQSVNWVTY